MCTHTCMPDSAASSSRQTITHGNTLTTHTLAPTLQPLQPVVVRACEVSHSIPGGSAANVMKGLANISGRMQPVSFMGMIGVDATGAQYRCGPHGIHRLVCSAPAGVGVLALVLRHIYLRRDGKIPRWVKGVSYGESLQLSGVQSLATAVTPREARGPGASRIPCKVPRARSWQGKARLAQRPTTTMAVA
jgi:hypothetical protein